MGNWLKFSKLLSSVFMQNECPLLGVWSFHDLFLNFFFSDGEGNDVFELENLLGLLPSGYNISLF